MESKSIINKKGITTVKSRDRFGRCRDKLLASMDHMGSASLHVFIAVTYIFLLGPILIIVLTSFNATPSVAFPPKGFSFFWYGEFLRNDNFTSAFVFSLYLGLLAALISTLIGLITAYGIVRFGGKRRGVVQSFSLLPAMVPHILISMALLLALNLVPFPQFGALLMGHVLICLPFTIAGTISSLDAVDPQMEAAAMTLGASRLQVLMEIVFPLVAPGIMSAFVFAFIVSSGDIYIALFLSGPGMTTLPSEIYSYIQWESTPIVAAITTIQILLIIALGFIVERLIGLRRIMRF